MKKILFALSVLVFASCDYTNHEYEIVTDTNDTIHVEAAYYTTEENVGSGWFHNGSSVQRINFYKQFDENGSPVCFKTFYGSSFSITKIK